MLLDQNAEAALPAQYAHGGAANCKLVMLALSQSGNEPVVILARTGLTHLVGAVPLLIISDRTFRADPERCIFFHLPFPFRASSLRQTVDDLLVGPAQLGIKHAA